MSSEFSAWLTNELEAQGWSRSDLARATGLHKGSISNVLNGQRQPSVDFVLAVARSLRVSPEDLYRRAGLLPPKPKISTSLVVDETLDVLQRLPPQEQQEVLEYALYRYQKLLQGKP